MEDRRQTPDLSVLEEMVGELERLADTLGDVPDEEGSREVGALLEGLGEWVPVSIATRIVWRPAKRSSEASLLVVMRPSSITSPLSVSSRHR